MKEIASLHLAAAALHTEGLFIWQPNASRASPCPPCQVLAHSPRCCKDKHTAGNERITASLIYLPQIKQTLTLALNVDYSVSWNDRRVDISIALPSGPSLGPWHQHVCVCTRYFERFVESGIKRYVYVVQKKKVELPTYFMLGISMNLKTFCMCTLLVLGDSALHIPGFNQQQVESIQEENAFKLNDFRPFLVIIP